MAKHISHDLTYDAPLDRVAAMLADPVFRKQVCDYQQVLRSDVAVTEADGVLHVRIDQVQAATGIPAFAAKFVGEEIHIVQSETWPSDDHGDIELAIPGKPGAMRGTATLVESGGVTTETVDLTVRVNIPLVGGKIEGLIADRLLRALEAEHAVGRKWLAR